MAIVRAPLKTDAKGKCTRWRVVIFNPATHKQEWQTVGGTRRKAEAFERKQKDRLASGVYVAKSERRTFAEVAGMFMKECAARNRRTSTIVCYQTVLDCHLMPKREDGTHAGFGPREVGTIRRSDIAEFFDDMRAKGKPAATINRTLRTMKAILFFALERELVERNVMQRFRPYQRTATDTGRQVSRDAYSEAEVRALFSAARDHERPFLGLLVLAGLRPGEVYALRACDLDLDAGSVRVARSWDHRGRVFVEPKTKAGNRTAPLAGWLVDELRAHVERIGAKGEALLFATANGNPFNPSNVRRDIWQKVIARAGVPKRDLYSLRHSFATLARASGEGAFNVSRAMGHSRSTLVDAVYAHSLASGLAGVAEGVSGRVFGKPKLTVIEGGARDVRQPLEESSNEAAKEMVSY
jgi:integrase